jgi:hypothetical protein
MMKCCWLLALVACGDDGASMTPDAAQGSADAIVDAAPGCDAAETVTVEGPAAPPDNTRSLALTVVSHDASGAVCNRATASGPEAHVSIATPPGGMVTAVLDIGAAPDSPAQRRLLTWTGVSPGEDLLYPSPVVRGATVQVVHVSLDVPVLAGAPSYDLELLCEGGGGTSIDDVPTGPFTADLECLGPATKVTAAVRARGTTTSFAVGDLAPITGGAATITLGAYAAARETGAIIDGAPDYDANTLGLVATPSPQYGAILHAVFGGGGEPISLGTIDVPAVWAVKASVYLSTRATPAHTLYWAKYLASAPSEIDLRPTQDFLPNVDGSVTGGWPRPTVTWSFASAVPDADLVAARVDTWSVLAPGQPGSIRFPELPADLVPTGAAELTALDVIDDTAVTGYAQAHLDPMQLLIDTDVKASSFGQAFGALF